MGGTAVEAILGAVVLAVAAGFLVVLWGTAGGPRAEAGTYSLSANFTNATGLSVGTEVRVAGVPVGAVSRLSLERDTLLALVEMEIDRSVQLDDATVAVIASESLLGGRYVALRPGGGAEILQDGAYLGTGQAPPSLDELLGQLIFSGNRTPGAAPDSPPVGPAALSPVASPL